MGFMSHRQKNVEIRPEQKWDYISLNDFKSTSCFTPIAYGYLYFSLLLSIAVYTVDTFTAVNLLVFNKWSSEIEPSQIISFTATKWIFSICIILSFLNLAYEHIRAQRIMHRGSVAECYLDTLAVRLESIRWGKGQGWKRFLVFAELTKSKKGAEYVALFTYFNFQSWVRVLLCSGPRQAVNAMTIVSVYNAKLSASGDNVGNTLLDLFDKIRALAVENYQQALILSGMLFTLIIWAFAFVSLLLAFFFFIFYLVCYLPREDGGLSGYCSRKINKRLMKIVMVKVNAAMAEEERRRKKAELKAAKKNGELPPTELKATLPDITGGDKLSEMPTLKRNDTMTTLPAYTSRPGTSSSFELSALDQKRPGGPPTRTGTMASTAPSGTNYSTRAPLLGYAAEPGRSASPAPSLPAPTLPMLPELGFDNYPSQPTRTGTAMSNRTYAGGAVPPLQMMRNDSVSNAGGGYTQSPATYSNETMPNFPARTQSPAVYNNPSPYGNPSPAYGNQPMHNSNGSVSSGRFAAYAGSNGRASPAPSARSFGPNTNNYPGSPMRSVTNPVQGRSPMGPGSNLSYGQAYAQPQPQRNMTAPVMQASHQRQGSNESYSSSYYTQSAAPAGQANRPNQYGSRNNNWNGDVESQRGPGRY